MVPDRTPTTTQLMFDSPCIYYIMLWEVCLSSLPAVAKTVCWYVYILERIPWFPVWAGALSILLAWPLLIIVALDSETLPPLVNGCSDTDKYSLWSLLCGLVPLMWCFAVTVYCAGWYVPGVIVIPVTIHRYRKLQVPGCTGWEKLRYIFPFVVQGR